MSSRNHITKEDEIILNDFFALKEKENFPLLTEAFPLNKILLRVENTAA